MDPAFGGGLALAALVTLALSALHLRAGRNQRFLLSQIAEEVASLREALISSGAAERRAKPPLIEPAPQTPRRPLPSVERKIVSVTRDDDPVHTRPTVEAPPPAGAVRTEDEPPSTKPSRSREVPAPVAAPRSSPRPVAFDVQMRRAMARLERQVKVPPEVQARWLERLAELGAELGMNPDVEPSAAQIETMIRELYQAEADIKDARGGAPTAVEAPATGATLLATVEPIAVRLVEATRRGADADGDATLRALPHVNVDEDDGRDTSEELTRVYGLKSGARDAPSTGARPLLPKPERPTLLGGLSCARPPNAGEEDGETS